MVLERLCVSLMPCFEHLVDPTHFDPKEWEGRRRRIKLVLARHARVPMSYWDALDARELFAYFDDFIEILKLEERQTDAG